MKRFLLPLIILFISSISAQENYTDTQGALEVSSSGSAVYTLPIAMPPSAGDVGPVIHLVYTSGSFGGIAGAGWNIQSISAISRIATRADIDGFRDGVDFDDNDKLALDGQRLILKSGNYWAEGSTYQTETKSNTKIELKGNGGSLYFVVTAPDGSRSWYGKYQEALANDITSWYIVRFEDTNGNSITYSYDRPFGKSLCISEIRFSGAVYADNPSLTNSIRFYYTSARRSEFAYIGGIKHEKQALLERVEVHSGGLLFRNYLLSHSADPVLGYEKLTQIQAFNPENEAANPILFEYHHTETTIEGSEYTTTYANTLDFQDIVTSGDFDGDGRLDFISDNALYTQLFTGNTGSPPMALPFTAKKRRTFAATSLLGGKLRAAQAIVNAYETRSSIAFQVYNLVDGQINLSYEKLIDFDNSATRTASGGCALPGAPTYIKQSNEYLEGDFNGDGISELLIIATINEHTEYYPIEALEDPYASCDSEIQHSGYRTYLVDLHPDRATEPGTSGYMELAPVGEFGLNSSAKKYVLDFNGDGKSDVLAINADKTYEIISFTQLPNPPYVALEIIGSGVLLNYEPDKDLLFGDFNGDGKADLMLPQGKHSDQWHIYYANPKPMGGHFFAWASYSITEYWPNSEDVYDTQTHFRNYYALDTNKDGKTDLVEVWRKHYKPKYTLNNHDTQWRITSFANNIGNSARGGGFTEDYSSPCKPLYPVGEDCHHNSDSPDLPIPVVGSYRHMGLNKELVMLRNHHNELTYIDFSKDVAQDHRLKKVTTSGGDQVYEIFYAPMEKGEIDPGANTVPLYSVDGAVDYPYVRLEKSANTMLVSALTHTAMGITRRQSFKYQNFILNMAGLGPLGFEKVARSAWYTNYSASRLWHVQENNRNLRGALERSYTQLSHIGLHFRFSEATVPENATQITTNSYDTSLSPNKVFSVLLSSQTQKDLLRQTSLSTAYRYDPLYALPLEVTTRHYSGETLQQTHSVTTTYDNNPEGAEASYYIGRPNRVNTETTAYGDVYTSETTYSYDPKGNVIALQKKGHNTETLTETMIYDGYGNVTEKTLSAPGVASRTTGYGYDPSGRFLIQKTDVEGLQTSYTYDSLYGLVLTKTNPYGLTTTYNYDGWGKKTMLTDALGNRMHYTYQKSEGEYTTTVAGDDGSTSVSVSDILGNVVREGTKDLNGNSSYVAIQYDALNRKIATSEPYFDSPSQWNTTTYDNYSRPIQTTAYTGKVTSINYSGLTTTVNDGTKTITTTKDAMGNVISHTDPGGTITYSYYANGHVKQSDYNGIIVAIQQDGWGRKTQLSDPSAGVYTYSYNSFGEITAETTPKGTTTYTYNSQGRLTKKEILGDETDMITEYSYDPITKQRITMEVLSGSEAFTYNYSYDDYQRPISTTEQTPYARFERMLQYDDFGRIAKEGYHAMHHGNGKAVTQWIQHQYKNGSPYQITDDATGQVLWETKTVNARGQLSEGSYGNGILATHEYDDYGLPMLYSHDKDNGEGTQNMMLLQFEFNAQRGILTHRSSSLFGWQESFTYDDLDRLTGFTDNNGSQQQRYDDRGRITENETIGAYSYSDTHPYQVTQVELTTAAHGYYQTRGKQRMVYNAFRKPVQIHVEGKERINFSYNPFKKRAAMFYGSEVEQISERPLQKYYSFDGHMEIKSNTTTGQTEFITYIGGDAYSAPVIVKSDGEQSEFLYLHRDYLGSILAVTDQDGEVLEKRHFDAWGTIVKLQDGQGNDLDTLTVLDRGYTGHEHLQGVALIHMNGRLYDPLLHRFLAPDNYVQDPYNTQNFNRYGYVYNNPLSYTDPSGELGVFAAIAIGAAVAAATYTVTALTADVPFTAGGLVKASLIGGYSGAITFGIGSAFTSISNTAAMGFWSGAAYGAKVGAVSGFFSSAASSWMSGESFIQGIKSGVKGALIGGAIGGAIGGISSGIRASNQGLDFWSGEGFMESPYDVSLSGVGKKAAYSNEYAKSFSDSYEELNRLSKNVDNLYADGSHPTGYRLKNGYIYNPKGRPINGVTELKKTGLFGLGKKDISVYLSKSAFRSTAQLYMTMHHEYMHAYFFTTVPTLSGKDHHRIIAQWHHDQIQAWNMQFLKNSRLFNVNYFRNPQYQSFFDYSFFGFKTINYIPK